VILLVVRVSIRGTDGAGERILCLHTNTDIFTVYIARTLEKSEDANLVAYSLYRFSGPSCSFPEIQHTSAQTTKITTPSNATIHINTHPHQP
jgi:hypothetical protein